MSQGQHSESGGSMCSHAEYTQDTRTAVTLCAHAWGRGPGQARDAVAMERSCEFTMNAKLWTRIHAALHTAFTAEGARFRSPASQ
eukprot:3050213-Prymnesium_polylepis.2